MKQNSRYSTLLDLAEAASAGLGCALGPSTGDDAGAGIAPGGENSQSVASSALGPSVGDDEIQTSTLGACVGDDFGIANLGPSVGDDANLQLSALGACVGDDDAVSNLGPSVGDDANLQLSALGACVGDDLVQPLLEPSDGDDVTPHAVRRFRTLLNLADGIAGGEGYALGPSTGDDGRALSLLGASVGDDNPGLGLSVGDDDLALPIQLGASVGDDNPALGLSVGDDQNIPVSDVRLKTDVQEVGTTAHGLPLYNFRYIGGTDRYQGVMAQDVLKVLPAAVGRGSDGYYRVNYRMLGIEMRRV